MIRLRHRRLASSALAAVFALPALPAVLSAAAAPQSAPGPDLSQGASRFDADVPAELVVKRVPTGHLLVQPVINGHAAGWFIFDTGAGICVISTPHVEALEVVEAGSITAVGVGGGASTPMYRAGSLQLGPLTLTDHPAIATDLSFLEEHLGEEIAGVIGFGVLSQCVVELDLQTPRLALHDPAAFTLPSGTWTPMSLQGRVPTVEARFEGHTGRFRLDTGANSLVTFHEPAVRRLALLEGRDVSDTKLGGVGGFVAAKRGTLASFELCGATQSGLSVEFATEARGSFADASSDGNIGARLLERWVLVFDYGKERLALLPHAPKPAPVLPAGGVPAASERP